MTGDTSPFDGEGDTPWEPPLAGTEVEALLGALERLRWTFRFKADGLDRAGLSARVGASSLSLHWMRESGLADLLPSLDDTVWVGVSAGSMVLTPRIGDYFVEWPAAKDDRTLGVVDFSIFPHLDLFPTNTMAHAERWAADLGVPSYAIDEQTAIVVVDDQVEVVSEGQWRALSTR